MNCALCKTELKDLKKHTLENCPGFKALKKKYPEIKMDVHKASLKETKYECPDCKERLKEVVPSQYFFCEQCDLLWNVEELS